MQPKILNCLLWIKWLLLFTFSLYLFFASKFVTFLEIDRIYSLVLIGLFSLFLLFVPYSTIMSLCERTEAKEKNLNSAQIMIKSQILAYVIILVIGAIFLPFESKYNYRERLVARYNQIDAKENALYLHELHTKFACCGVTGQKFNITTDPTVWNPDDAVLRQLPKSCCKALDESNQCTATNVYRTTCETVFNKAAHTYKTIVLALLSVCIGFTLISLFVLNRVEVVRRI